MPIRFSFLLVLCLLLACWCVVPLDAISQGVAPVSFGEGNVGFVVGGTAQVRATYAQDAPLLANRLGFGIRRLRLRMHASTGQRVGFFVQADGADANFKVLDLAVEYRPSSRWRLRAGRIISARPAGFNSHTRIDAVDRPVTIGEWAKHTIGADGHDFGVEARFAGPQGEVLAFLHNGDGHWDRARGNFREEVGLGSSTRDTDRTGLAATVYAAFTPTKRDGLDVGGFVGINTARNPNTAHQGIGRAYTTYGAHVYGGAIPGSWPVRVKAEVVGLRYETLDAAVLDTSNVFAQQMLGASVLAAVRFLRAGEVFARYERFDPNTTTPGDTFTFATVGGSLSTSALRGQPYHRERITLAWTMRMDATETMTYGLILQAQLVF
ncbi:MAG TPA: hypothetical protein VKP65_07910 [Rhodothermales bacterium]|nr:hypothetical protein [Rhodothermales bacterium]